MSIWERIKKWLGRGEMQLMDPPVYIQSKNRYYHVGDPYAPPLGVIISTACSDVVPVSAAQYDAERKDGDLNDNALAKIAKFQVTCLKGHTTQTEYLWEWTCPVCAIEATFHPTSNSNFYGEVIPSSDVKQVALPGGIVFDKEEFKKFQAAHPEYAAMQKQGQDARFKVTAQKVDGVGTVGISRRGQPAAQPKGLLDELSKKDGDE